MWSPYDLFRSSSRAVVVGVIAALGLLVLLPGATEPVLGKTASPAIHKVDLLTLDGAEAGFVNFHQTADGDLRLVTAVKGGVPNTVYQFCLLPAGAQIGTCAAQQGDGPGVVVIGRLTTNGQGNGDMGEQLVSVARLRAAYGPGQHSGEAELQAGGGAGGGCLIAEGLTFTVPTPDL
jgi:hypothetical protein